MSSDRPREASVDPVDYDLEPVPLYVIGQHQARLDLNHRAYPFIFLVDHASVVFGI